MSLMKVILLVLVLWLVLIFGAVMLVTHSSLYTVPEECAAIRATLREQRKRNDRETAAITLKLLRYNAILASLKKYDSMWWSDLFVPDRAAREPFIK